jgi:hypothetical protein
MSTAPTSSRLFGPVLAGVAAVLSAGVWLIPQRAFVPAAQVPPVPVSTAPVKPLYEAPKKETRWPELAAKLEALREPWKGPDPNSTSPTEAPPPVEAQLAWEYVGYVEGAGMHTAIVVINNVQRFIAVGESVSDPTFPNAKLVVKSIDAEKIEVEHQSPHAGGGPGGVKGSNPGAGKAKISTIKRKQPDPIALVPSPHTPAGIAPGTAGTPGLNTGGGRGLMPGNPANPRNPNIPENKFKDPRQPAAGAPFQAPLNPGVPINKPQPQPIPTQPSSPQPSPQPAPDPTRSHTTAKR